jgi:hypothetical protein
VTWFATVREKLRVSEKRVLRRIFGFTRDGGCMRLEEMAYWGSSMRMK